jgi:type I restriction enzyme R subunit
VALTEADTCLRYITPAIVREGWDIHSQISLEHAFTDGRVIPVGLKGKRRKLKRADYLLSYRRNQPIAVVEAKAWDVPAENGVQQAMEYAQILGLYFAYAANGKKIIEHDFFTGKEAEIKTFPSPEALWARWRKRKKIPDTVEDTLLTPYLSDPQRKPRHYQVSAINRTVEAILAGKERMLLCMASGTGKSFVAAQICYRLWNSRWNRKGKYARPKILYLADRLVLLDQPMMGVFAPFEDALHRIKGKAVKSRDIYFTTYQQVAEDENRTGLYKEYDPDFFDLIVVDECHRGSAKDESNWREILTHFTGAVQLGMTATPKRDVNVDTYKYFGNPLITYTLAEGIEDGFLAPYKVRRVITSIDATGFRPEKGQKDSYGDQIPDELYQTPEFERILVIPERTDAMARYITGFLKATDRFGKTMVFCVDQEHASAMRAALARHNQDLVQKYPDYVCRVTSDEGDVGRAHLSRFQDIEETSPVILTTSEMLTTGVDAPTVQNVVLCRVVNSMVEFKQIMGRGTRLRTDYDKWYFTVVDFTGSASEKFADPEFDGYPEREDKDEWGDDEDGDVVVVDGGEGDQGEGGGLDEDETNGRNGETKTGRRKYYVDGVHVEIGVEAVYILDPDGKLRTVELTDYTKDQVRKLYRTEAELRAKWVEPKYRSAVIDELEERGIDVEHLAEQGGHLESDPFDLLCHVAFDAPLRSRGERAEALRKKSPDFWDRYTAGAQEVLNAILDKYAEIGPDGLDIPDVLQVPPLTEMGTVIDLANRFGGAHEMATALHELQERLYAA